MTQYEYLLITRDKYDRAINTALERHNVSQYALDSLYAHRNNIAQRIDVIERNIIDTAKSANTQKHLISFYQ